VVFEPNGLMPARVDTFLSFFSGFRRSTVGPWTLVSFSLAGEGAGDSAGGRVERVEAPDRRAVAVGLLSVGFFLVFSAMIIFRKGAGFHTP
jgi:hypothetical protein